MSVPNSGSLRMSGLAKEKLYDDYNSSNSFVGPIFMSDLVTGGNSSGSGESYDATNPNSYPFLPDNDTPHEFSEWFGYNHDVWFERFYPELYTGYEDGASSPNPDKLVYDGNVNILEILRWRSFDMKIPDGWQGLYIRPKVLFYQSNQDFRNDVAISTQWVWLNADKTQFSQAFNQNPYYTGSSSNFGQREVGTPASPPDDPNVARTWEDIPSSPTNTNNQWCIETLETPSNDTGPEEDPMYLASDPIVLGSLDRGAGWYQIGQEAAAPPYFYYESSGTYSTPQYKWFRYKDFAQIPADKEYLSFCYSAWSGDGATDFQNDYLKVFIEVFSVPPPPTFS